MFTGSVSPLNPNLQGLHAPLPSPPMAPATSTNWNPFDVHSRYALPFKKSSRASTVTSEGSSEDTGSVKSAFQQVKKTSPKRTLEDRCTTPEKRLRLSSQSPSSDKCSIRLEDCDSTTPVDLRSPSPNRKHHTEISKSKPKVWRPVDV